MANPLSNLVGVVGNILSDIRTHRIAGAVAAIAVGLIGLLKTNATDLGLDEATLATIVGGLGILVAVAREFAAPILLPAILAIFGARKQPEDPFKK